MFSAFLDFSDALHGRNRSPYEFSVIANWNVSPLLKIDGRILQGERIGNRPESAHEFLTMVISLPCALRNAFVHLTFRGFRFILGIQMVRMRK